MTCSLKKEHDFLQLDKLVKVKQKSSFCSYKKIINKKLAYVKNILYLCSVINKEK